MKKILIVVALAALVFTSGSFMAMAQQAGPANNSAQSGWLCPWAGQGGYGGHGAWGCGSYGRAGYRGRGPMGRCAWGNGSGSWQRSGWNGGPRGAANNVNTGR
jgi:hypothetical protein